MGKRHFARACRQKENNKRRIFNVTEEETTTIGDESDQSETRIYRIENINRITGQKQILDYNSKNKRN